MNITDACVFPYPSGDSSVRRMALEASALGFDSMVAIDTPAGTCQGVAVLSGVLIHDVPARDLQSRVKRAKENGTVVAVQAGNNGFNRLAISTKGVHLLTGIQDAEKNAFDHVAAKMAADNGVAIDLDLSPLITGRGTARQRALHRYRDVMVLERRFGFSLTLSSHARSILDMRAVREVTGLCSLLDMEAEDVERALSAVGRVTARQEPAVRVVG
jgi:ribonuclease P/MRP protein subunit RPP1